MLNIILAAHLIEWESSAVQFLQTHGLGIPYPTTPILQSVLNVME